MARAMEKMRELTQRGSSGSTELAASAEQMSKMARVMLGSMDRFVLEGSNGHGPLATDGAPRAHYAAVSAGSLN